MPVVNFAEWRPDSADLNSNVTADVENVLCADGSYIPFPKVAPFSDGLEATPFGAYSARDSAGQITIFAGTAGKLWRLNNTTLAWDDVSQAMTTYNSTVSERWRFAQFGNFLVAVNANDAPQVFELGVSTEFEDLAGSPPPARYIAVWGDFLVLGGLTGNPNRVHWSGLNNIEMWTPGTQNSDFQDFPDGGDVHGMTNATNPIIFQKGAIRLGTFVPGSTEVFTFQKIHDKRGSAAPYAIATRGAYTFFADSGGFFQIGPDGSLAPIGFEKVDRTIFNRINGSDLFGIIGEVDPFYSRVYWAVKYDSTSAAFDRLIVYDWNLTRWTQIDLNIDILFPLASGTIGYTLEGLDDVSTSLDALPFSLDSKVWQGGAPVMAAFDINNMLGFFSGNNAEATITTQEMGDVSGMVQRVNTMFPLVDTNDVYVSIGARMRRGDDFVWGMEAAPSSNTGIVRKKCRARFHKFRVRIPEDIVWNHAQGLNVDAVGAGMR